MIDDPDRVEPTPPTSVRACIYKILLYNDKDRMALLFDGPFKVCSEHAFSPMIGCLA